jgi:hypothetical protein
MKRALTRMRMHRIKHSCDALAQPTHIGGRGARYVPGSDDWVHRLSGYPHRRSGNSQDQWCARSILDELMGKYLFIIKLNQIVSGSGRFDCFDMLRLLRLRGKMELGGD